MLGRENVFATGPTVYADMLFDTSGKDAKFCATEEHDGGDTVSNSQSMTWAVDPFESEPPKGYMSTYIDGMMSSGVDDKVGAVETTIVVEHSSVYFETKYGKTCTGPMFDEEAGWGADPPDAKVPGVDPVHMADGGTEGESEHENPNVVSVKTDT